MGGLVHSVFTDVDVFGVESLGPPFAVGVEVHDHALACHLLQGVGFKLGVAEQLATETEDRALFRSTVTGHTQRTEHCLELVTGHIQRTQHCLDLQLLDTYRGQHCLDLQLLDTYRGRSTV